MYESYHSHTYVHTHQIHTPLHTATPHTYTHTPHNYTHNTQTHRHTHMHIMMCTCAISHNTSAHLPHTHIHHVNACTHTKSPLITDNVACERAQPTSPTEQRNNSVHTSVYAAQHLATQSPVFDHLQYGEFCAASNHKLHGMSEWE